jgi:hypothetical protein
MACAKAHRNYLQLILTRSLFERLGAADLRNHMDAGYFLKQRTSFIRFFYDESAAAFRGIQARIEAKESPFDDPPYSEDPEPPYFAE